LVIGYKYSTFGVMSKNKKNTYRVIHNLPQNASRVSEYAAKWPCNTSYIYKLVKEGKNKTFEIVDFMGINFVIPINET